MIYKILHRKLKIEQHKPHSKKGGIDQISFKLKDFSVIFLFQVTVSAIITKGDFMLLDGEPDDL